MSLNFERMNVILYAHYLCLKFKVMSYTRKIVNVILTLFAIVFVIWLLLIVFALFIAAST